MSRILTTRRSQWLPGMALVAGALAIGALLGSSFGQGSLILVVALAAGALGGFAGWQRLRKRPAEPVAKQRGRLRTLPGGKAAPYDLADDDSTKNQRYLM